jgi:3'-phosphoadenosine 5'-phosphosulfate sulfotransferase
LPETSKTNCWRCRIHGGASTGPRTEAGLARVAAANTKHGRFTKIEKAKAKARAQRVREIWKELKEIENWCIEHGHLKKNWRKDFYI